MSRQQANIPARNAPGNGRSNEKTQERPDDEEVKDALHAMD
jgi:hypothetical protein